MKPIKSAMHVCSLSLSPMKKIAETLKEAEMTNDRDTRIRLQWLQVSMEFNRLRQMQYIFQHLGSKQNSPKFRPIRLGPFWHQWKKEVLRDEWAKFRENVDRRQMTNALNEKSQFFEGQRIELAAKTFLSKPEIRHPLLKDILNIKPVSALYSFSTPGSNRPGYFNQGYNYVESTDLTMMSDVSNSGDESDNIDPWDRPLDPPPQSSYTALVMNHSGKAIDEDALGSMSLESSDDENIDTDIKQPSPVKAREAPLPEAVLKPEPVEMAKRPEPNPEQLSEKDKEIEVEKTNKIESKESAPPVKKNNTVVLLAAAGAVIVILAVILYLYIL